MRVISAASASATAGATSDGVCVCVLCIVCMHQVIRQQNMREGWQGNHGSHTAARRAAACGEKTHVDDSEALSAAALVMAAQDAQPPVRPVPT